jgi:hypothetical protein
MSFDPDKPYNDLPLLPSKTELESKAVLRKAIAANKALAELKGVGELSPRYRAVYWPSAQRHRGPDPPGYGCMKIGGIRMGRER